MAEKHLISLGQIVMGMLAKEKTCQNVVAYGFEMSCHRPLQQSENKQNKDCSVFLVVPPPPLVNYGKGIG